MCGSVVPMSFIIRSEAAQKAWATRRKNKQANNNSNEINNNKTKTQMNSKSTFRQLVNVNQNISNSSYLAQLEECREKLKNLTHLVRQDAAHKAWRSRRSKTTKAQTRSTGNSDRSMSARKAWETRRKNSENNAKQQCFAGLL